MAKYKNVSGEDRLFDGRLVLAGAVIDVEDDDPRDFNQPTNWQPVKPSKSDADDTTKEN